MRSQCVVFLSSNPDEQVYRDVLSRDTVARSLEDNYGSQTAQTGVIILNLLVRFRNLVPGVRALQMRGGVSIMLVGEQYPCTSSEKMH